MRIARINTRSRWMYVILNVASDFAESRRCIRARLPLSDDLILRVFSLYGGISSNHGAPTGGIVGSIAAATALTLFLVRRGTAALSRRTAGFFPRDARTVAPFQASLSLVEGASDANVL